MRLLAKLKRRIGTLAWPYKILLSVFAGVLVIGMGVAAAFIVEGGGQSKTATTSKPAAKKVAQENKEYSKDEEAATEETDMSDDFMNEDSADSDDGGSSDTDSSTLGASTTAPTPTPPPPAPTPKTVAPATVPPKECTAEYKKSIDEAYEQAVEAENTAYENKIAKLRVEDNMLKSKHYGTLASLDRDYRSQLAIANCSET